jgi:hypothetical protein
MPTRIGFHDVEVSIGGAVAKTTISIGGAEARQRLMRERALEDAVGTAVSGLVAVGVGWVIFEPGWVGAVREMFGAFVWAFGLDLGLSRIREIAPPGVGKPAAPAG